MYEPRLVAVLATTFAFLALAGCDATPSRPDAGPSTGMDAGGGMDAGTESCTTTAECDDSIPCTLDECVVGNVCQHTPRNGMCTAGEVCSPTRGCTATTGDCMTDADCDDGDACNGVETCIVARMMCLPGARIDCDDNNMCTVDTCDPTSGACTYDVAPGCDAGGIGSDAGPPCNTFDPATDYDAGSFLLLPSQSCSAGTDMYNVANVSFSVAGDMLTVTAGRFTLTQSPLPTGASFDVSGGDGCATVRLQGVFECENSFNGTWTANHGASCAACGTSSGAVSGVQ